MSMAAILRREIRAGRYRKGSTREFRLEDFGRVALKNSTGFPVGSLIPEWPLAPGAVLTPTGLRLDEGLSEEQVDEIEYQLYRLDVGISDARIAQRWAIGDFCARYGERRRIADFTGFTRGEIRKLVWVARNVPVRNRIAGVDWSYFEVIAPDPPDVQLAHLRKLVNAPSSMGLKWFRGYVKDQRGGRRAIEEPVKTEWDYQCPHCGFGWDGEKKPKWWVEWGERVLFGGFRTYSPIARHEAKPLLNPVPATVDLDQPKIEDRIDADTVEHDARPPAARRGKRPRRSS